MALIPPGEWLPDQPPIENTGALTATNVVPKTQRSYGPWRQLSVLSTNALDSRPLGAFAGYSYAGGVFVFAGDAAKLYSYTGSTFADVSKAGGYATTAIYADAVSRAWNFTQFGNLALVSNLSDPIQSWTMGTSSIFADLAPLTAPKGKYLAAVGDFLVVAYTDDAFDGQVSLRLWWSPIGAPNDDDWGNTNKQSDFRTLPIGRYITGLVGGEYGLIFCRDAIYRMTYAGPPAIFSIDRIESGHGCIAPGSIAQKGDRVFYLAEDGFKMRRGAEVVPIGAQKVDGFFFDDIDASSIDRCISVVDSTRKLYLIAYPGDGSTSGRPNRVLAFNYEIGRWATAEQQLDLLSDLSAESLTVEALGAIYTTVEDIPGSIDSPAFSGGTDYIAAFGTDKMLSEFTGANAAMILDTTEINLVQGRKARLRHLRAMIDTPSVTVRIGTRNQPDETPVFGAATSRESITGLHSFKSKARYHRARLEVPAGAVWTECYGVADIEFSDAGKR
jgi:hypothetical protein